METATKQRSSEAAIWERIVHPDGALSPKTARAILDLSIPQNDLDRMHELVVKNQAGKLSNTEEQDLDNYCRVGLLLSTLKSRARQVLNRSRKDT